MYFRLHEISIDYIVNSERNEFIVLLNAYQYYHFHFFQFHAIIFIYFGIIMFKHCG